MIVAAHQPAYLPWLGYFDKIARADLFVVMDDLQYVAQNFQNRNRVKLADGEHWLTVPLQRGHRGDPISAKQVAGGPWPARWQRDTWLTLVGHYSRAPFFNLYARELEAIYLREWDSLVDLNLTMLSLFLGWLRIDRPVLRSSSLGLRGVRSERIIDMCQRTGADTYLSGAGASCEYLDLEAFERAGLHVTWQRFEHPVYPQRYPHLGFMPRLAVIDLLFNCGPQSGDILLSRAVAPDFAPVVLSAMGGR